MDDPREARLPKWAQGELCSLRRRVHEAEARADEARRATGPSDSDTLVHPWDEIPFRLGKGTRVRFLPSGPEDERRWADVRVKDGALEVMASEALRVAPQVTNVVHLEVRR